MTGSRKGWMPPEAAAARLRIGAKTLAKWVDGGMLAHEEHDGETWISEGDVARLALDRDHFADRHGAARRVLDAALEGDVATALRIVREETAQIGSLAVALEVLIVPSLVEVGARWDDGTYLVADEHVVSSVFSDVLVHVVEDRRDATSRGKAACFVLGDDPHSIGARLCQACLESRGYRTFFVGGGVPAHDAVAWLARVGPLEIVCFSLPATASVSAAEAELEAIATAAPGSRLFIGGAGARGLTRVPARSCVLTSLFELESLLLFHEGERR